MPPEQGGSCEDATHRFPAGLRRAVCISLKKLGVKHKMGFGKDGKGEIITETKQQALGTLGNVTAITVATPLVMAEDFRIIKTEMAALVTGLTTAEGQGLMIGIANGALTVAQIAEAISAQGPLNRNDRARQEFAMRFVKLLATIAGGDNASTVKRFENAEGGGMISETIRWTFSSPEGWQFFVWNNGVALTTGSSVRLQAKHFGVWVT